MLAGSDSFIADARVWLRRFGGNLFTLMPYAVSAKRGFDLCRSSFNERWVILTSWVDAVKSAAEETRQPENRLVLTPEVPHACMVHVHVKGELRKDHVHPRSDPPPIAGSKEMLEGARDTALALTGSKVFRMLRGASTQGDEYQ